MSSISSGGRAEFVSSDQVISSGTHLMTLAHGLGVKPRFIQGEFVCVNPGTSGYSVGNAVLFSLDAEESNSPYGCTCWADATNIYIRWGSEATYAAARNHYTTGVNAWIYRADWKLRVKADA